jgi:hypothetical protein
MLRDAERLTQRLARVDEGPASLDSYIRRRAQDEGTTEAYVRFCVKRENGEGWAEGQNALGRKMRGESEDCRPSLVRRGANDGRTEAEGFEDAARTRRRQMLGR